MHLQVVQRVLNARADSARRGCASRIVIDRILQERAAIADCNELRVLAAVCASQVHWNAGVVEQLQLDVAGPPASVIRRPQD